MIKPMTPAELLKRLKGKQSGISCGYKYEAEFWEDDEEWVIDENCGPRNINGTFPTYWVEWEDKISKHLNRFYDNESNPGPKWEKAREDYNKETDDMRKELLANRRPK